MNASPHILIAEDEDLVALALADLLQNQGYRVTVAHNGKQALEAEEREPVDILLTDMRMPVMDGRELIRHVRQRRPDLPVVVMTGYSENIPREEAGRLAVLRKPFPLGKLGHVLQTLLPGALPESAD
ncbi:response regulator [Azospirillum sp. SYSU D00513]|uniref:response regulator n=1 Tax=Azospirillum sp. SYSU D00513 TaxID=2812561 RepID=UPI001A958F9B|nr:response regulator [Azospirillum sp. SYSU D00513]